MINMTQYKNLRFADSDRINFAHQKAQQEADAARLQTLEEEAELREKFEKGQISPAEYATLSSASAPISSTEFQVPATIDNSALMQQLTDEDYQYLNLK